MMNKRDHVLGLGEIGMPIFQILSKNSPTTGYDVNPKMMKKTYNKYPNADIVLLHVCIPFSKKFLNIVKSVVNELNPQGVVIHSTIEPHTTEKLQRILNIPVIYSATRGVHKRMLYDLKRYVKFYSVYDWAPKAKWVSKTYSDRMKKCRIKTIKMSNPLTLELAKIVVDTSYYGWLINYAQISNMIAIKNKINYDEMWSFADEIHKYLGNRPKMFPGFIGGHCVIPNLDLMEDDTLSIIRKINSDYAKILKKKQTQGKKY